MIVDLRVKSRKHSGTLVDNLLSLVYQGLLPIYLYLIFAILQLEKSSTLMNLIFFPYFNWIFLATVHCKYIGRKYYDILSCLIYHRNFVVACTVDA